MILHFQREIFGRLSRKNTSNVSCPKKQKQTTSRLGDVR